MQSIILFQQSLPCGFELTELSLQPATLFLELLLHAMPLLGRSLSCCVDRRYYLLYRSVFRIESALPHWRFLDHQSRKNSPQSFWGRGGLFSHGFPRRFIERDSQRAGRREQALLAGGGGCGGALRFGLGAHYEIEVVNVDSGGLDGVASFLLETEQLFG